MSDLEALLRWWVVIGLLSTAAMPFVLWLGRGLGSEAASLGRLIGPFAVTFVLWWPAAVLHIPFTRVWLIIAFLGIASASWTLAIRSRSDIRSALRWIVVSELIWTFAFAAYALFRRENAAIAFTEKPMEIALLSSIFRSTEVPAPDPWLAGEHINYYYFGYQIIAALAELAGVAPSIAFNLALASTFATAFTIAAALAWSVLRHAGIRRLGRFAGAALTPVLLLLAGNLETTKRLVSEPSNTISAGWWDGVGWQASRVIRDEIGNGNANTVETINEFPAFSMILADLHPHVIAIPFVLGTLALAIGLVLQPATGEKLGRLTALGVLGGMMYAINSWDAPIAIGVLVIAIAVVGYRQGSRITVKRIGVFLVAALVAVVPFVASYTPPVGMTDAELSDFVQRVPLVSNVVRTIGVVTWQPSSTGDLLTVYGHWIGLGMLYLLWGVSRQQLPHEWRRYTPWAIVAGFILLGVAVVWSPALILLGVPAALALFVAFRDRKPSIRVISLLFAGGFLLALAPEFVFIQDAFGHRMNTVFKLGYQAWILLAIGSGCGLVMMTRHLPRRPAVAIIAAAVLLVGSTLTYTPISVQDWISMGPATATLDGDHFIARRNADESRAINWVRERADEGDILVEAPGCGYGSVNGIPMSRFSAFSGVPTIIGWDNHERQWRRSQDNQIVAIVAERQATANAWLDGEIRTANPTLQPRFLIFGIQEQSGAPNCDVAPPRPDGHRDVLLEAGWAVGYQSGAVAVLVSPDDPVIVATEN